MADQTVRTNADGAGDDETTNTLREIADLEAALALEIARLRRTASSADTARSLWWWRMMLRRWASDPRTRSAHDAQLLLGLVHALQDFEAHQLVSYFENVETEARKSA